MDKDEPGFLDFLDLIGELEKELLELTNVVQQITSETVKLGNNVKTRSKSINQIAHRKNELSKPRSLKQSMRVFDLFGNDMSQFANRVNGLMPQYSEHLSACATKFGKLVSIYPSLNLPKDISSDVSSKLEQMSDSLIVSIEITVEKLDGMRNAVQQTPSMTRVMNRGRSAVSQSVQKLNSVTQEGLYEIRESNRLIKESWQLEN